MILALIVGGVITLLSLATGILDAPVPLWALIAVAIFLPVAFPLPAGSRRPVRTLSRSTLTMSARFSEALQKIVTGNIPGVSAEAFIERGILVPADNQWLVPPERKGEAIRLSVLSPEDGCFSMLFETRTFAGGPPKVRASDHRFLRWSRARRWRDAMDERRRGRPAVDTPSAGTPRLGVLALWACAPVRVGSEIVAILSVLSTKKHAFLPSEADVHRRPRLDNRRRLELGQARTSDDDGGEH